MLKHGDTATNEWFAARAGEILWQRHQCKAEGKSATTAGSKGASFSLITSKRRKSEWGRSHPSDFGVATSVYGKALNLRKYLPYAVDWEDKELTFVDTTIEQVRHDPFLYVSQYRNADVVVWAKIDDLPNGLSGDQSSRLTFVFSIGRCGSTLTSNLAKACGLTSYSECDALVGLPPYNEGNPQASVEKLLRSICGALLEFQDGEKIVIKMKSSSNRHIQWFMTCFPNARFIFLTRALAPWAASFVQVFNWKAEQMFKSLKSAVEAHARLQQSNQLTEFLRYEDLVAKPQHAAERMFGADTANQASDAIKSTLAADSQSGLLLRNKALKGEALAQLTLLRQMLRDAKTRGLLTESPVLYDPDCS